jgi:hypothetical protein
MPIFAVREVEPWTAPSIVAGVVLLALVVGALYLVLRRYLGDG